MHAALIVFIFCGCLLATGAAQVAPAQSQPPLTRLPPDAAQLPLESQDVAVDYNQATDFSRFRTYAWAPFLVPLSKRTNHVLVTRAIEVELSRRGLEKATGQPDVLVNYWYKLERKLKGSATERPPQYDQTDRRVNIALGEEKVATFAIEIVETISRITVWQARDTTLLADTDLTSEEVGRGVARLLKSYPPGKP
jgi:hypothetical protein